MTHRPPLLPPPHATGDARSCTELLCSLKTSRGTHGLLCPPGPQSCVKPSIIQVSNAGSTCHLQCRTSTPPPPPRVDSLKLLMGIETEDQRKMGAKAGNEPLKSRGGAI